MGPQSCLGLKELRSFSIHVAPGDRMAPTTIQMGNCKTPKQVIVQPIAKWKKIWDIICFILGGIIKNKEIYLP